MTIKLFSDEYYMLQDIFRNNTNAGQYSNRLINKLLKLNFISIESEAFGQITKVKLTDTGLASFKDIEANSTDCDSFVKVLITVYLSKDKGLTLPPFLLNNGNLSDRGITIFTSYLKDQPVSYSEELVKYYIEDNISNLIKIIPKENIPFLLSRLSQEESEKLSKALMLRPCGNSDCSISTGIHGCLTFDRGKLDEHGFWEIPCDKCARNNEVNNPKDGPCWPHTVDLKNNDLTT